MHMKVIGLNVLVIYENGKWQKREVCTRISSKKRLEQELFVHALSESLNIPRVNIVSVKLLNGCELPSVLYTKQISRFLAAGLKHPGTVDLVIEIDLSKIKCPKCGAHFARADSHEPFVSSHISTGKHPQCVRCAIENCRIEVTRAIYSLKADLQTTCMGRAACAKSTSHYLPADGSQVLFDTDSTGQNRGLDAADTKGAPWNSSHSSVSSDIEVISRCSGGSYVVVQEEAFRNYDSSHDGIDAYLDDCERFLCPELRDTSISPSSYNGASNVAYEAVEDTETETAKINSRDLFRPDALVSSANCLLSITDKIGLHADAGDCSSLMSTSADMSSNGLNSRLENIYVTKSKADYVCADITTSQGYHYTSNSRTVTSSFIRAFAELADLSSPRLKLLLERMRARLDLAESNGDWSVKANQDQSDMKSLWSLCLQYQEARRWLRPLVKAALWEISQQPTPHCGLLVSDARALCSASNILANSSNSAISGEVTSTSST